MNNYFLFLCIASLTFNAAAGEQTDDYRFYLSGSFNRAFGDVDAQDMNKRMQELGYDANADLSGQNRNAWDFAFGYRITDYLDVQLGYTDLGEVRTRLSGNTIDINDYLNSANLVHPRSADGPILALRGRYYLNDDFFLYGRAGVLWADSHYFADANIENAQRSKKEESFFFGIGYEYEWSPRWSLHLAGDVYRVEDESIKVAGIGLAYRFGAKSITKPVVDEKPAVKTLIKPDPAPEPKVNVPVEIELAINFDPDSAVVKPDFYNEIENLAIFMRKNGEVNILLEGHTDNRGNDQHNQSLSQRRVDAVMDILINRFDVDTQRLAAQGFGEARPIADNETVEGRARNRRVVAQVNQ